MILRIEGQVGEVTEFLDRINKPRIIPFPVLVKAGCGAKKNEHPTSNIEHPTSNEKKGADATAPDIEKEKTPADKPKPYSGGQGSREEKSDKKPSAEASRPTPKKQPGRKPSRPEITLQDIRKEVGLNECGSIPEAIEAILQITGISGAHLGKLLGIDKSAFSKARNGTVGPLVKSAFKQHFPADTSVSDIKKVKKTDVTPEKKASRMPPGKGSMISLERLLEVDLSDCDSIPAVINKLQLKTNITGTRLAGLLEIHACDLSKARKGVTPPFIERAFKQHLQFSAVTDN